MKKILNWIMLSSQDSTKVSLTLKSTLTLLVTALTIIGLPKAELGTLADQIVTLVQGVLVVVSAATGVWGMVRKINTTMGGTNSVLNDPSLR